MQDMPIQSFFHSIFRISKIEYKVVDANQIFVHLILIQFDLKVCQDLNDIFIALIICALGVFRRNCMTFGFSLTIELVGKKII